MVPKLSPTSPLLPKLKPVRIAIYARYSGKNQSPLSAKEQTDRAVKHIRKKSILFEAFSYAEFIRFSDEAKSGTRVGRQGYDDFKKCIELGECDVALVDDLSRIVRDLGEQMDFYHLIKYKGIELHSICDQISSEAATAKVHFQIKGIANEMERDQNAARTRRGLEARLDRGFSCGDICFGYRSEATQERTQGGRVVPSHYKIIIHPEEAKTVNLIFDLYIKELGLSAIAKELNKRRIPSTQRGLKITGKKINWGSSTVRKILTNEKYIGHWLWGRTKTIYNPITKKNERQPIAKDQWISHFDNENIRDDLVIVSLDKWSKVQARFAETKRRYENSRSKTVTMRGCKVAGSKGSTLLAGILRCEECGSPMLQITKKYYGCYTYHRKDPTKCSNKRMLNQKKIEGQAIRAITKLLMDQSVLESATKILNQKIKARLKMAPEELKSLELKKREAEREIQNLLKFITQHGNSSQSVKDYLRDKESELSSIRQQVLTLKSAQTDKILVTPFALKEEFKKLTSHFESDPVMANAALRKMIPNGLSCRPEGKTTKKNLNQNNSKWCVTGELAISCEGIKEVNSTPLIKPNLIDIQTCF